GRIGGRRVLVRALVELAERGSGNRLDVLPGRGAFGQGGDNHGVGPVGYSDVEGKRGSVRSSIRPEGHPWVGVALVLRQRRIGAGACIPWHDRLGPAAP